MPKTKNKFLRWIGSFLFEEIQGDEFVQDEDIEIEDVVRLINTNKEIVERLFKVQAKYLVIGSDQMKNLKIRLRYGAFSFDQEQIQGTRYNRLGGLTIIFVPWMKGVVVLPDIGEVKNQEVVDVSVI